ncbi:hypothetical protein DPEC_G00058100 [Dallia pectoralis]|uniref:Uncharacterized protein n=1 Tax=Dallia pectoralis TaxID=75939 RepID=A0ACC2H6Q3_DALPE|nr:hypothetical protein DPEC_G00058100 [Dallia pectoralis]
MSLGLFFIICSLYLILVSEQTMDQEISFTRTKGQSVSFSCKNTDQCGLYIFWYQKKEHEPFIVIVDIAKGNCDVDASYNHPQKDDFSATKKETNCDLKIQGVFTVWEKKIFGSGTRLYVTGDQVQTPKVTVYPASNPEENGKTTLLCLARDMFPDLVKILWKMEDRNGQKVNVPQGEVLEQMGEGQTTSMIIIDKEKADVNKYICSVKHEGGIKDTYISKDKPTEAPPTTMAAITCPSTIYTQEPLTLLVTDDSFQSITSLNLASLTYTVMIVKTLVYCCGLTILIQLRNMGSKPSRVYIY